MKDAARKIRHSIRGVSDRGQVVLQMEQMLQSQSIQQMVQSPAMQQMLESPELQRITESPAFMQIANGVLGGVPPSRQSQPRRALAPSNPGMSPGQGAASLPNMNALMQALMPIAQQVCTAHSSHYLCPISGICGVAVNKD